MMSKKTLVHVLGVVYVHTRASDGGDLYLTQFAEPYEEHLAVENWHEKEWFNKHKIRLEGTSAVYRVPTKEVEGKSIDLVVKNSRVGEDVPVDTHTLQEYCDAEFNSPWEEFALNDELREGRYGPDDVHVNIQHPMAIYIPPEKMQLWQSGRSRSKINRIRAKHPGIDLDILKQYKLVYRWIGGKSLTEIFQHVNISKTELEHHLKTINDKVFEHLRTKGFLVADMKPEHIIISENDIRHIEEIGRAQKINGSKEQACLSGRQVKFLYDLINSGKYSVVDYELLLRTPEYEEEVKYSRRHSYLDNQRDRFIPTPLPSHLSYIEVFGVPYMYGHAESTGGHLWVVGKNARLFDYFLPERWRKTPSFKFSEPKEVFYTITKDNIHLVWKTSRVGEIPAEKDEGGSYKLIDNFGINSPFEEFSIAHTLNQLGISTVYVRAIYMTGSTKIEPSGDFRKYETHKDILDPEGNPVLQENHNYITIRGYYNGPDHWVAEHESLLFTPIDLSKASEKGILSESQCQKLSDKMKESLKNYGYDGSLLKLNDILLAIDDTGKVMKNDTGEPEVIICNFELIWKIS
ncbi:MAG: hypothetical protein L0956_05805 [Candidatus Mariimomonas ferrooxydans]